MRILIFNWRDTKHTYAGGAEIYIHELAKRWVSMGNSVTLFCGNDLHCPRYETVDGVQVIRRGGFYLVYIWAFLYYMFRFRGNYDVILDCQNGIPFFTPLYAKEKIFSLLFHVHQKVFWESLVLPLAMLASFLEERLMPLVYKEIEFITISQSSKRDMEGMKIGRAGIHVVTPGVDTKFMRPGSKASTPTVLYLGRLKKYKSVDVLINAIPRVLTELPKAQFIIAGDGEEKGLLAWLMQKNSLRSALKFTGRVSEEQKRKLYQQAWIFVNPSLTEGWSITNIEASACGTPVIAANVPGMQDSVKDGQTGILVEQGDSKQLAQAIIELLQDTKKREQMGKNSVAWAQNYSWDASAKLGYTILYEKT